MKLVSVTLGIAGKFAGLYIFNVVIDSIYNLLTQVAVVAQEFRLEPHVHAQHVLDHQHLAVAANTGTNSYGGDAHALVTRWARAAGIFSSTTA